MLRDGASMVGDEQAWAGSGGEGRSSRSRRGSRASRGRDRRRDAAAVEIDEEWRAIDRSLRRNAKQRATLDADDLRLLRDAERVQIWKPLGMVNMVDYVERVLGYAPRTAQQWLQVARGLEHLPEITEALSTGELPFSAVRELVRVATPSTEAAWCAHVGGMNLRQIEEAVAGHKPGDLPTDAPVPELRTHRVVLELSGAAYALWRQAALALDEMHERRLDDDERASVMANAVLESCDVNASNAGANTTVVDANGAVVSASAGDGSMEAKAPQPTGRARYQIALTVCRLCDQAWQEGGGLQVPVDPATLARARCDAQYIVSLDGDDPERAYQAIPPSIDRFVRRRDGGRCQTPGCRSTLGLEIHHIVHREHGGTNHPSNLTLRCWSCHDAHHRGVLTISGIAPHAIVTTRNNDPRSLCSTRPVDHAAPQRAHVNALPSKFDQAALRTQARDALVGLGWKSAIATAAVDEARANGCVTGTLESLIREALRRCPLS